MIIGIAGLCLSNEYYMTHNNGGGSINNDFYNPLSPIYVIGFPNGLEATLTENGISIVSYGNDLPLSGFSLSGTNSYSGLPVTNCYPIPNYGNTIPFSDLQKGDEYSFVATPIGMNASAAGASGDLLSINFKVNYIPTQAQLDNLVNGTPANMPYSFNQAMSIVSTSAIGIAEILLIVIGVLILVAVSIVVYAKSDTYRSY